MKYAVISATKVKDRSILALEAEYLKRMRFCEIIELGGQGNKTAKSCEAEGQLLLKYAGKYDRIVSLDENGKQLDSKALGAMLASWRSQGAASFAFLIGGAYGLSDEVKKKSHFVLSLSALTFPFKIARMLTVEQLYRTNCIIDGHPYHKD